MIERGVNVHFLHIAFDICKTMCRILRKKIFVALKCFFMCEIPRKTNPRGGSTECPSHIDKENISNFF
jgi:hypothetical protein